MKLKFTAIVGFCLALAACGGGGGGGGGGGFPGLVGGVPGTTTPTDNTPAAITFSPAKLTGNQQTGISASYVVKVNVANPDLFTGPVYVLVLDSAQILKQGDGLRLVTVDRITYSATLNTSASLAPGRYQGTFSVSLCKDQACAAQYTGSPVSLPYDLNVTATPLAAIASSSTRATVHVGAANPPEVDVQVGGPGGTWKATTSSSWLKVAQAEGQLPATIKARFVTQGMAAGTYQDDLVVRSADGQEAKVGFTLEMLPTQFQVSTESFSFNGVNGAPIPSQTLNFTLDNGTPTSWTASTASPWLLLAPGAGTTPGSLTARVDASKSNLVSGNHNASIVLASTGYPSKNVGTTLALTTPTLSAPSTTVMLGGPKGRDDTAQSVAISLNTGSNQWPWTLSTLPAWITGPASGNVDTSGTSLSFSPASNAAPGSQSGVATVRARVNGDTVTLPLDLVLNRDKRQLLPSEWGIGFASLPSGSVLKRTLKVADNFGGALPWTATSSASWLSVTASGTTGSGSSLVLTADPKLAPLGAISYATVTLKTSSPDVASAVVQVGLWRSGSELTALTSLPAGYTHLVADKIRPYVYAHNSGASIDIYNAHLGTKVGTIANVGTTLAEMTVAPDGSKLYAGDTGNDTVVVVDLATGSKIETWPLTGRYVRSAMNLLAIRPNGKDILLVGDGIAYADGRSIASLASSDFDPLMVFSASSDGRTVFAQNLGLSPASVMAFDIDYSAIAGGTLMVKPTATRWMRGTANGRDVAVNADASAFYVASAVPGNCYSLNPADLALVADLPGASWDSVPTNIEITTDGRVLCGASGGGVNPDLWIHSPDGRVLKSFKFVGKANNLLERQLAVTPDGMTAISLTSDPQISFIPLGAP
jgi:YVTN family beta-propeller protein